MKNKPALRQGEEVCISKCCRSTIHQRWQCSNMFNEKRMKKQVVWICDNCNKPCEIITVTNSEVNAVKPQNSVEREGVRIICGVCWKFPCSKLTIQECKDLNEYEKKKKQPPVKVDDEVDEKIKRILLAFYGEYRAYKGCKEECNRIIKETAERLTKQITQKVIGEVIKDIENRHELNWGTEDIVKLLEQKLREIGK